MQAPDKVFFDFEASSLSPKSYPIELGWACVRNGHIKSGGSLIQPTYDWLENGDWSRESERIHGLSQERILVEGRPPSRVLSSFLDALDGTNDLFCSCMKYDGFWLSRLIAAVCREGASLQDQLIVHDIDPILSTADVSDLAYDRAIRVADRLNLKPHRAEDDAYRLAYIWQQMFGINSRWPPA